MRAVIIFAAGMLIFSATVLVLVDRMEQRATESHIRMLNGR